MADSDKIEVGDIVLAIGNPFGIGQTVTTGMVSATGRATQGLDYEDFIQTDAAINPGNSGGALVDAEGRLIGINTAILSRSGGNQGIGFAIPVNLARDVMESLVKDGRVTRGYLGVMIQDVTPALAKEFKLKDTRRVGGGRDPDSPAEKAGLQERRFDYWSFNGKKVERQPASQTGSGPDQTWRTVPGESAARWRNQNPRSDGRRSPGHREAWPRMDSQSASRGYRHSERRGRGRSRNDAQRSSSMSQQR